LEVRDGEAEIEPWLFELQVWNRGIKEVGEDRHGLLCVIDDDEDYLMRP
jgi:hypothetical protein